MHWGVSAGYSSTCAFPLSSPSVNDSQVAEELSTYVPKAGNVLAGFKHDMEGICGPHAATRKVQRTCKARGCTCPTFHPTSWLPACLSERVDSV